MFRKVVVVLASLAAAAVVAGCQIVNPSQGQLVSQDWGVGLAPGYANIGYLPGANDAARTLDIYPAALGGSRGTIVFVHGGGFTTSDKYPVQMVGPLLRQTHRGWSVVSVNYRLVSGQQNLFPAASQDVAAALRWVQANGSAYGLNTSRLVVAGHSAGGTLATLAATTWNSPLPEFAGTPRVTAFVAVAPVLDCLSGWNSVNICKTWLGDANATQFSRPSATSYWDPQDPPGYLIHGDSDGMVELENSLRFDRLAGTGVKLDVVDRFADGSPISPAFRNHAPMSGANATQLDAFFDSL